MWSATFNPSWAHFLTPSRCAVGRERAGRNTLPRPALGTQKHTHEPTTVSGHLNRCTQELRQQGDMVPAAGKQPRTCQTQPPLDAPWARYTKSIQGQDRQDWSTAQNRLKTTHPATELPLDSLSTVSPETQPQLSKSRN